MTSRDTAELEMSKCADAYMELLARVAIVLYGFPYGGYWPPYASPGRFGGKLLSVIERMLDRPDNPTMAQQRPPHWLNFRNP